MTETTKKPRKSTKAQFVIQYKDGDEWTDPDMAADDLAKLDSTAACLKYINDQKLVGTFRIIAVKATFTTVSVQTTKIAFK